MNWDQLFIGLARLYAQESKDDSTQVGCVIVDQHNVQRAGGFNGLPRRVSDDRVAHPERHARPKKYEWYEHAERNAIFNAARVGVPLEGCTLYVAGGPPCADCARAVIQSGIAEVVVESYDPFPAVLAPCEDPTCARNANPLDKHYQGDDQCSKENWRASVKTGFEMLREAGVRVRKARLDA